MRAQIREERHRKYRVDPSCVLAPTPCRDQLTIDRDGSVGSNVPAQLADTPQAAFGQLRSAVVCVVETCGDRCHVERIDEHRRSPGDLLRRCPRAGDHRRALRHRFGDGQAEALPFAGIGEH